ncbi:MAG: methyltransferase domain-containing protein [Candidatus Dormibacteraceae bacterium]
MSASGQDQRERYVHGYEEWTRKWMSQRTAARDLDFLIPHLKPGISVLDCGCGPGSITADLAAIVAPGPVVGIDIEPRQLEAADRLAKERGATNLTFQQASVYSIPFPDASFDVCVAHFVLEHVSDPLRGLREMLRVLRPGGVAAIKDPYYPAFTFRPRTPELELFETLSAKVREHNGASATYAADLRAYLLEAGFRRTEAQAGLINTAGDESAHVLPMMLTNQVREPAFRDTVLKQGWATETELDAIGAAAQALAARPDLFGFIVFVKALGWV